MFYSSDFQISKRMTCVIMEITIAEALSTRDTGPASSNLRAKMPIVTWMRQTTPKNNILSFSVVLVWQMSMLEQERTRKVMMTKMISLLDVRLATWILRRCLTMMEQMLFKIVDAMTSMEDIRKYSLYPSPFSCRIRIYIWI